MFEVTGRNRQTDTAFYRRISVASLSFMSENILTPSTYLFSGADFFLLDLEGDFGVGFKSVLGSGVFDNSAGSFIIRSLF